MMEKPKGLVALTFVIAAAFSLFHLWTSYFGGLPTLQQVYVHLGFALVLIFITRPVFAAAPRLRWLVDGPFLVIAVIVPIHAVVNYMDIAQRGAGDATQVSAILGVLLTVLVLDATRRMVGWALPLLAVVFLIYGFIGQWMPGPLAHRGFDVERIASTLYLTDYPASVARRCRSRPLMSRSSCCLPPSLKFPVSVASSSTGVTRRSVGCGAVRPRSRSSAAR